MKNLEGLILVIICIIFFGIGLHIVSSEFLKHRIIMDVRWQEQDVSGEWVKHEDQIQLNPSETALIVLDMWDNHRCVPAAINVKKLAPGLNEFISAARESGVQIVHSPSATMQYYENYSQYRRLIGYPDEFPETNISLSNFSVLGECVETCDNTTCPTWKNRQVSTISIFDSDLIGENKSVLWYFSEKGIKNILLTGVHTNRCIIDRELGINGLLRHNFAVYLVRDMTDPYHFPDEESNLTHQDVYDLVIEFIERTRCPTVNSSEIVFS
ncbi:isochorismatase family protein [Candidatus Woesearchaeota archaeon]|nr:isochorismatase family protein [Candidatus Woesearchaeota archaeon]